jgi:membrane associated rhomboid family serine protease
MCTKIKNKFIPEQKQIKSSTQSGASALIEVTNNDKHISIEVGRQDLTILQIPTSIELHFPIFTIIIGTIDILMLIAVYVFQEGTVLTSDTWIKMGCKYVPCMKPLDSKVDQDMYNVGLKSQCQSLLFPYQFFRFFTPIFLHGGITHLLSNLIYQALAGSLLERNYRVHVLGVCYILFGFSGNIMSALCNPKSSK